MPSAIDSHTHRYPPEVIADPAGWAQARGETHWRELVAPKGRRSLQGWATRDSMLAAMDAAGVERAVILGWYWEKQTTCNEANAWHARWLREDPERFLAFASVQPLDGPDAFDDLRRAIDAGCCGIGECLPAAQGFSRDHPTWLKMLAWAEETSLPVNLHVTEAAGRDYPGRVTTPFEDLLWTARQFPRLKLILAHWGGGLPFYELNPAVRKALKNVHYDTAASPLLYDGRIWHTVADLIGPERILFGSDFPLLIYPGMDNEPGFQRLMDEASANLTTTDYEAIMRGNAARIFDL